MLNIKVRKKNHRTNHRFKIDLLNNKSPPGGFSSLFFDQAVPYYSQRHLADWNVIYILHRLMLGQSVVKCCYLCCEVINQFKNFPFTQFMNAPCRTVLKQLLLPAMVTTRALNSALFIIFHTHFCPLQFKVFQGCLK